MASPSDLSPDEGRRGGATLQDLLRTIGGVEGLTILAQTMSQQGLTSDDLIGMVQASKRPRDGDSDETPVIDNDSNAEDSDFSEDDDRYSDLLISEDERDEPDEEGVSIMPEFEDDLEEEEGEDGQDPCLEYLGEQHPDVVLDEETERVFETLPKAVQDLRHFDARALIRRTI